MLHVWSIETKNTFKATFLKFKIYLRKRERKDSHNCIERKWIEREGGGGGGRGVQEEGRVYSRRCLGGNVM
jgi:hypothetical protein